MRRPSESGLCRFVAHLLIRLLILAGLPPQVQAAAALYPISLLWMLDESGEARQEPAPQDSSLCVCGGPGGAVSVIDPPVYDPKKLAFSFPDANGIVTLTAPAGTLPPGATVLVINAGNGVVATFTADNDGAIGVLVPAELPASISDRLLITIEDPSGNVTTFEKSEFVDPATGRTAVGPGGGTVLAADDSGAELRIPAGATDKGVVLRIESFQLEDLPEDLRQTPDFPEANFGSGLKIESPDTPVFKKEVKLAFPLAAGLPENPKDAFFYVVRRVEGPAGPDGRKAVFFETIDEAYVEGEGEAAKVVTASPPFSGYTDSLGGFGLGGLGQVFATPATTAYAIYMWTYDQLALGQPSVGVISGKVFRQKWNPGAVVVEYEPLEGVWVSGVDAQGQPLLVATPDLPENVARSQKDGTFTLHDAHYQGGTVQLAAVIPGSAEPARIATAYQINPADSQTHPRLRPYRNQATVTFTFPAVKPPDPPPLLQIRVFRLEDGQRVDTKGLAVANQPLVIGFSVKNGEVRGATINGREYGVRVDPLAGGPEGMDRILDPEFTPPQPGSYTVTATALAAFGPPVTQSLTFRVVAEGGSNNDPLPGEPPRVMTARMVPKDLAVDVPVTVFMQVVFTEPVRRIPGNVTLTEPDGTLVPLRISGVGPSGPIEDLTMDPSAVVTSLTLEPLTGLRYGTKYTLSLTEGIQDLDQGASGSPAPMSLIPESTSFTTFSPRVLSEPGTGETFGSAGIAVLGHRAFLVENQFSAGFLRVFDVTDPASPVEIDDQWAQGMTGRPVDIAGEESTVVVAMTTAARSIPSSVYVYDVSDERQTKWVGVASVVSSVGEGFINKIAVKDERVYVATGKKGIQVVDVAEARRAFPCGPEPDPNPSTDCLRQRTRMRSLLATDGGGFGQTAVVGTVPVSRPPRVEGGPPQPSSLYDLEVGDFVLGGQPQRLVVATGFETPLVIANPDTSSVVWQGILRAADGSAEMTSGVAVGLGRVANQDVAVVVGGGLVGGAVKTLLATVSLADPEAPEVLGFLDLGQVPCLAQGAFSLDVLVKDQTAYIGWSNPDGSGEGCVVVVNLSGPSPTLAGVLPRIGGRLAISDDGFLFATAISRFGAPDPLGGVRAAALEARYLMLLRTRVVLLPQLLDPSGRGTQATTYAPLEFELFRHAQVRLRVGKKGVDEKDVLGVVDKRESPELIVGLPLPPGVHTIWLSSDLLANPATPGAPPTEESRKGSAATKPFRLEAIDTADVEIRQEATGKVTNDPLNRPYYPVGHTFVKGVSLADGHLTRQVTDVKLPGRHLALEVTRSYSSSRRGEDGRAGAGWTWTYDSRVRRAIADKDSDWLVHTANGDVYQFSRPSVTQEDGVDVMRFLPERGRRATSLVWRVPKRNVLGVEVPDYDASTFDFTDRSGNRHHFAALPVFGSKPVEWRLASIEEPHGDRIELAYWPGRVVVSESHGKDGQYAPVRQLIVLLRTVAGVVRIDEIQSSSLGLRIKYGYDTLGNLTSAKRFGTNIPGDPGPAALDFEEIYTYSTSAPEDGDRYQLLSVTDANDHRTSYRYDDGNEAKYPGFDAGVLEVREFAGENEILRTVFNYDFRDSDAVTQVTDPRGNTTVYTLNADGQVVRTEEPLGDGRARVTQSSWLPRDSDFVFKDREEDALGVVTVFTPDPDGRLKQEDVTRDGQVLASTQYEYGPFDRLKSRTDAEDRTTQYDIDPANGDIRSVTDPRGNVTSYGYTGGLLTSVTDARGSRTEYQGQNDFGQPTVVKDPAGTVTSRGYDARGRLTRETDSTGRDTRITYDGLDRVRRVERKAGGGSDDEVVTIDYYPGGQIQKVTNAKSGVTEYAIDGANRVTGTTTTIVGDQVTTSRALDGNGNVEEETDGRGVRWKYVYDPANQLREAHILSGPAPQGPLGLVAEYFYDDVGRRTGEVDISGRLTEYTYDDLDRVRQKVFPEPGPSVNYFEEYTYDRVGNRLSVIDANGNPTSFEYDELDRVKAVRRPGGLDTVITYEDPEGSHLNKSEETEVPSGLRTSYLYDALNRERERTVHVSPQEAHRTKTDYQDASRLVTVEDPRGKVRELELDHFGRVIRETVDPAGLKLTTRMSYDGLGKPKSVTNPRGQTTSYEHDGLGRLREVKDATGKTAVFDYDGGGLRTEEVDRRDLVRRFEYDNLGRLTKAAALPTKSGVGFSRETIYDDAGRRRIERDARGNSTVYHLDGLDRVVRIVDPRQREVLQTWDGVNLRSRSDKRNREWVTRFEYDALDRLKKITDPLDQVLATDYRDDLNQRVEYDKRQIPTTVQMDALGRVRAVTREATLLARYEYDGNDNRELVVDGEGRKTRFVYDAASRLSARVDGDGSETPLQTDFSYLENGRVVVEQDARAKEEGRAFSVKYEHDVLDRVEKVIDGGGNETRLGYDEEGYRTSVEEPGGGVTGFSYGELGELLSVTQPTTSAGTPVTRYEYDPSRNRVKQVDAGGREVRYGYDDLDRLTSMTEDPSGENLITLYTPDDNGNVTSVDDPRGNRVSTQYDRLNRPESRTYLTATLADEARLWRHTTSVSYHYDASDNLDQVLESVASGTDPPAWTLGISRAFDRFDRVESETVDLPDGQSRTVEYGYFANGLRKRVLGPDGSETFYDYDPQNRLKEVRIGVSSPTVYQYFGDGRIKQIVHPNGVATSYGYFPAGHVQSVTSAKGSQPVSSFGYLYDVRGNRLSQVETQGGVPEPVGYTYDALNRLETVTYPDKRIEYGYDPVGNRTLEREKDASGTVLAERIGGFDTVHRLRTLTDNVSDKQLTFGYDRNGNLTSRTEPALDPQGNPITLTTSYLFDARNLLVEAQQGESILGRFQYDAEGRRNKKIGEGGIRQYVYDGTSALVEYDDQAQPVVRYDYGPVGLLTFNHRAEGRRFAVSDALGSITNLTAADGSPVVSYRFDAWGSLRDPSALALSTNRITFTGHRFDPELGQYYAQARYYAPNLGRFTSQDPFLGWEGLPASLNRYVYVENRPTLLIDPMGLAPETFFEHLLEEVFTETPKRLANIGRGAVTTVKTLVTEPVNLVRDLAFREKDSDPFHSALLGGISARLNRGESLGEALFGTAVDIGANTVTLGLFSQGKALKAYYAGEITLDQLDEELSASAGAMVAAVPLGAGAFAPTRFGWRGPQLRMPTLSGMRNAMASIPARARAAATNVRGFLGRELPGLRGRGVASRLGGEVEQLLLPFDDALSPRPFARALPGEGIAGGSAAALEEAGQLRLPFGRAPGGRAAVADDIPLVFTEKRAQLRPLAAHDEYVRWVVGENAKQRTFKTPWSASRGLGTRRFDAFDRATGTYFEGNTTPWSQMTQAQLSRKLAQAGSDWTLMQTNRAVKRVVWFGTEALPSTGLGAQLKEALARAGIPYWVVRP